MDLRTTFGIAAGCAALAAFSGWRGARPFDPQRGPRMMPWRFIMLLAAAATIGFFFEGLRAAGINPPGR